MAEGVKLDEMIKNGSVCTIAFKDKDNNSWSICIPFNAKKGEQYSTVYKGSENVGIFTKINKSRDEDGKYLGDGKYTVSYFDETDKTDKTVILDYFVKGVRKEEIRETLSNATLSTLQKVAEKGRYKIDPKVKDSSGFNFVSEDQQEQQKQQNQPVNQDLNDSINTDYYHKVFKDLTVTLGEDTQDSTEVHVIVTPDTDKDGHADLWVCIGKLPEGVNILDKDQVSSNNNFYKVDRVFKKSRKGEYIKNIIFRVYKDATTKKTLEIVVTDYKRELTKFFDECKKTEKFKNADYFETIEENERLKEGSLKSIFKHKMDTPPLTILKNAGIFVAGGIFALTASLGFGQIPVATTWNEVKNEASKLFVKNVTEKLEESVSQTYSAKTLSNSKLNGTLFEYSTSDNGEKVVTISGSNIAEIVAKDNKGLGAERYVGTPEDVNGKPYNNYWSYTSWGNGGDAYKEAKIEGAIAGLGQMAGAELVAQGLITKEDDKTVSTVYYANARTDVVGVNLESKEEFSQYLGSSGYSNPSNLAEIYEDAFTTSALATLDAENENTGSNTGSDSIEKDTEIVVNRKEIVEAVAQLSGVKDCKIICVSVGENKTNIFATSDNGNAMTEIQFATSSEVTNSKELLTALQNESVLKEIVQKESIYSIFADKNYDVKLANFMNIFGEDVQNIYLSLEDNGFNAEVNGESIDVLGTVLFDNKVETMNISTVVNKEGTTTDEGRVYMTMLNAYGIFDTATRGYNFVDRAPIDIKGYENIGVIKEATQEVSIEETKSAIVKKNDIFSDDERTL